MISKYKVNPLFLSPLSKKAVLILSPGGPYILTSDFGEGAEKYKKVVC